MIVYHGSNGIVSQPILVPQNRYLDFGFGFYTTTNKAQAIAFADKVTKRRRVGIPSVSIYEIDDSIAFANGDLLRFDSADADWLAFVSAHRAGSYSGKSYDFVLA